MITNTIVTQLSKPTIRFPPVRKHRWESDGVPLEMTMDIFMVDVPYLCGSIGW